MNKTVSPDLLKSFVSSIFARVGVPANDAEITAEILVDADMRGITTHGIFRLPMYVMRLENGSVNKNPKIRIAKDVGSMAIIDGDYGLGQVVAHRALDVLLEKAKRFGISAITVRKSGHIGAVGYYTRLGAMNGCITLVFTNASGSMFPFGGNRKVVGNNPWSIAIPQVDEPIVLDISNGVVARGKIRVAAEKGEEIPLSWALDSKGCPTSDPKAALQGSLQWIGGHKGYGISIMVDMLSSLISEAASLDSVINPAELDKKQDVGHFMIGIDVSKLLSLSELNERVKDYKHRLKERGSQNGGEVLLPGEPEERLYKTVMKDGINVDSIPATVIAEIKGIASKYRITPPF